MKLPPGNNRLGRFIRLAGALVTLAAGSPGAVPDFDRTVEQALIECSHARPKAFRASGRVSIGVAPFTSNDTFKGENVGVLTAEMISRHLSGIRKLEVKNLLPGREEPRPQAIPPFIDGSQVTVAGEVGRSGDSYRITMRFLDAEGLEAYVTETDIPAGRFQRMLGRHLRWKRQTWVFQPYLQALYTERYLAEGGQSRVYTGSLPGVPTAVGVGISRLAIDETAEFTGGLRLTWRGRLMLDLAYTAHGFSTSEGQYPVIMFNLLNTQYSSRMMTYLSTSAASASMCGKAKLYGDLHGYAGAGWERTSVTQTVSSMSRLRFSGPGGTAEVSGTFLSPSGPMPGGGSIADRASLPFLRAGFEWRPGRMGFNFLATYRLGTGGFRPLRLAVEEIYTPTGSEPRRSYYEVMDVSRYRLPRLSVGAAFALTL